MSDLHELCRFSKRPITATYVEELKYFLRAGVPATYTLEEAYNYTHGIEQEPATTTTPLHIMFEHVPSDATQDEIAVVNDMVTILLEYGAGWCLTSEKNETPGCILIRRNMHDSVLYDQIVAAGVRAELLLRKVTEYDMEVVSDTDDLDHEAIVPQTVETGGGQAAEKEEREARSEGETENEQETRQDPSFNQKAYLNTELEYKDGALVTKSHQDGVMMDWETDLMALGCASLFKGCTEDSQKDPEINILNIGFGMGIVDTMIQERKPTKHYICEAHPDVLKKLKDDGWYDKPNVVILAGRWQEQLDKLLSAGNVYFNGIYYDTFSEHYSDMLELFDYVVGLLKPHGVFSFFNGLGADRQVVYEVYKKLVEIDLANYGMQCEFQEVEVSNNCAAKPEDSVWEGIRRPYWSCPKFYHPEARFIEI